jgi:hypothetical protein
VHNVDAELNDSVLITADRVKHELIEILESFDESSTLPPPDPSPVITDLAG